MGRVKNEHFVPQSYLKAFANKKEQIFVYDKINKKSYQTNIINVAAEGKYFEFPLPDEIDLPEIEKINKEQLIEKYFANDIEGPYKHFLDKIRTRYIMTPNPLWKLAITDEEKNHLSYLITIQMLRVKKYREVVSTMEKKFIQMLLDKFMEKEDPQYQHGDIEVEIQDINSKILQASMILDPETIHSFSNEIFKHCWFVLVNNTDEPFYTSDNPVVKYAHKRDQFLSYSGISSEGVEIALPLSPKLILVMFERTFHYYLTDFENKFIPIYNKDFVDFYNYLQVSQSYRQIFNQNKNFTLIDRIMREKPEVLENQDIVEIHHNGKIY